MEGKSALIIKYIFDVYNDNETSTCALDFKTKNLNINNEKVILQLWDTAGQERYNMYTKLCYKNSNYIFVCFDVTRYDSFLNIKKWINMIKESCVNPNICIIALKNDCDKIFDTNISKKYAEQINVKYVELSAKNDNSDTIHKKLFSDILESLIKNDIIDDLKEPEDIKEVIDLSDNKNNNKSECCNIL